jgi:beta-barrel assembly-enhancing protease
MGERPRTRGHPASARLLAAVSLMVMGCGVSTSEEKAIGDEYAKEIERQLPLISDPALAGYVSDLGNRIAASGGRSGNWRFTLVDAKEVNAFAIPGGHIYVNRGLAERARNESELAGVLGHEIGHVLLRHSAEQLGKQRTGNVVVGIVCSLTSFCNSEAARVAINVGGAAVFARYSRQDELEADSAGIELVARTGFDPRGVSSLFEVLMAQRSREPAAFESWFGTHPLEETRIRRAEDFIARRRLTGRGEADETSFRAFQQRLAALPPSPSAPPPR